MMMRINANFVGFFVTHYTTQVGLKSFQVEVRCLHVATVSE